MQAPDADPLDTPTLDLALLDLAQLALFVGMAADDRVLAELRAAGFDGLRKSHGYIVQRLLGEACSITDLARFLGVTQQAASKSVAELAAAGYIENAESDDARVRRVRLSERGQACVRHARKARRRFEQRLRREVGEAAHAQAHALLVRALEALGGAEAVRRRRVRPPEAAQARAKTRGR